MVIEQGCWEFRSDSACDLHCRVLIGWTKCLRGVLKLPKIKSRFWFSKKRLYLEGMFSGEVLIGRA